jgi:hypothetical protein
MSVFKIPKSKGAIIGSLAISFNLYEYRTEKPVGKVKEIAKESAAKIINDN